VAGTGEDRLPAELCVPRFHLADILRYYAAKNALQCGRRHERLRAGRGVVAGYSAQHQMVAQKYLSDGVPDQWTDQRLSGHHRPDTQRQDTDDRDEGGPSRQRRIKGQSKARKRMEQFRRIGLQLFYGIPDEIPRLPRSVFAGEVYGDCQGNVKGTKKENRQ